MYKIYIVLFPIFCTVNIYAQDGMWTWISGDTTLGAPPNYGIQGISDPSNYPSGAYEGCEWTDKQGNFWYFGGGTSYYGTMNDLWKYEPTSNLWTWMKGLGLPDDSGSYGIQGIPSASNLPPCRLFGMASWTDTTGNLWLYGGFNNINNGGQYNTFNDLWKYDVSTNVWTWISGANVPNQSPVYGIKGVPSSLNTPGARSEAACRWTDNSNNLWLFGGYSASGEKYNDLWKYDISSNEWTWVNGSDSIGAPGIFGIKGIPNSLNTPSGRSCYSHWKDSQENLWLFGGWQTVGAPAYMNDLWKYNIGTNEWTWMRGDSLPTDSGYSVAKCVIDTNNEPSSRMESRSCWVDNSGNFWLFGGLTLKLPFPYAIWLNDMWMYNPNSNKWTWVWGDTLYNQHGNFGEKGITSPCNDPLGRWGSVSWYDSNTNSVYLIGGYEYLIPGSGGTRAELWKYQIDTSCTPVNCLSTGTTEQNLINKLTVFPNPTSTSITVSFESEDEGKFELSMYNIFGELVFINKAGDYTENFSEEISLEGFSDGIYFLQLTTTNKIFNAKVIKQ